MKLPRYRTAAQTEMIGVRDAGLISSGKMGKLERGLAQVRAGQGTIKTIDELETMAEDFKD